MHWQLMKGEETKRDKNYPETAYVFTQFRKSLPQHPCYVCRLPALLLLLVGRDLRVQDFTVSMTLSLSFFLSFLLSEAAQNLNMILEL
jgi:hypothetical protein